MPADCEAGQVGLVIGLQVRLGANLSAHVGDKTVGHFPDKSHCAEKKCQPFHITQKMVSIEKGHPSDLNDSLKVRLSFNGVRAPDDT
jgi:hypothetical protein